MNYPSRHVADLTAWGKPYGIVYDGVAKSGHARFTLPDGTSYTTSCTPSDTNATEKARRDLCKLAGIPYESGRKNGKHRHKPQRLYKPATVRVDSTSAVYARLAKAHRDVCDRIRRMQTTGAPREDHVAVIRELCGIEAAIERLDRDIPHRTFRVLNQEA